MVIKTIRYKIEVAELSKTISKRKLMTLENKTWKLLRKL